MIGLGWRGKDFGPSLVVSESGKVVEIPKGEGRNPGHGPEHDFVVIEEEHPHGHGPIVARHVGRCVHEPSYC